MTETNSYHIPEPYHRTRDDTRSLIIDVVTRSNRPLTRTQIARAIGRKKSPNLIDILNDLVKENVLSCGVKTFHNGVEGYVYWSDNKMS